MGVSYLYHYYRTHKSKLIKNLFENMVFMYVHKFQKSYCEKKKTAMDNTYLTNYFIMHCNLFVKTFEHNKII